MKCERVHVLHTDKDIDLEYHTGMNHNHERDTTILRRLGGFHELLCSSARGVSSGGFGCLPLARPVRVSRAAQLDELRDDAVLASLHDRAVAIHTEQARRLRVERQGIYETLSARARDTAS